VIDLAGSQTIVFDATAGNVAIRSLSGSDPFSMTGGSLTVTGSSTLFGAGCILGGGLPATRAGAQFPVSGQTTVTGASLAATGGATLSLPNLTSFTNTTTANSQTRTLQASGAGSVLDLRNVASITNGQNYDTHLAIQALAGGTVNLSGTT